MTGETRATTAAADRLRSSLVDVLHDRGTVRTPQIEAALRMVPRHLFLPAASLDEAYADGPVVTKRDGAGVVISTASQPSMIALMLEQLEVEPGQHVLEIGAGTGYNAGLLGQLAGPAGQVTTIDLDEDIVTGAQLALAAAHCPNVRVLLGDGAHGYASGAPYDRVIATVGVWDLPPAWLEQTTPDGLLVVPLRLRGSVSRSVAFERGGGHWRSRSSAMCGFIPLRGLNADPQRIVPLTPDGAVHLYAHPEQAIDDAALAGVLDQPRSEAWTGVIIGDGEALESLYLWLACALGNSLSRMPVPHPPHPPLDGGLIHPQFRWGTMAVADRDNLAYLTLRPAADDGGSPQDEAGVIGNGPGGGQLAGFVADGIRRWDRDYRSLTPQILVQPADAGEDPVTGEFIFETPHNRLAISWA